MSVQVTGPAYKTRLGNTAAKAVLVLLADCANEEGVCWPLIAYIVKQAEVQERTVRRVLQIFGQIGLVSRVDVEGRTYKQAFQINLEELGKDHSKAYEKARAEAHGPTDIQPSVVPRTVEAVPGTKPAVPGTEPPHPHIGGTVIEPSLNLAPKDKPSGPDQRFTPFRDAFNAYFLEAAGVPAPWDGKESAHLSRWLKKNPTITAGQWETILRNRARSPVNHALELSAWLMKAFTWLEGMADERGSRNGTAPRNKIAETGQNLRAALGRLEGDRGGAGGDGVLPLRGGNNGVPHRLLPATGARVPAGGAGGAAQTGRTAARGG